MKLSVIMFIIFSFSFKLSLSQDYSSITPCLKYPELHNVYNSSGKWYHKYIVSNVTICPINNKRGYTRDSIFKIMMSNSSFQAPTFIQKGIDNCGLTVLSAFEAYPGTVTTMIEEILEFKSLSFFKSLVKQRTKSPIVTHIDMAHYSATNYTLKGHPLHDGKVTRTVIIEGDNIKVYTVGEGNSKTDLGYRINSCQICMDVLWDKVDERLKSEVERRLKDPLTTADELIPIKPNDITLPTAPVPSIKALVSQTLVGGTTPDELGRIIFKALKTNDRKLFTSCIHPNPLDNEIARIEKDFDRLKEEFAQQGLSDWTSTKFSRVTFTKNPTFGSEDGGMRNGEQVRRSFTIEFTFNNQDFLGKIGGGTIVTFKNKYFIWNGGFSTRSYRL